MHRYEKIAARFFNHPWAMLPEKLQEIVGFIEIKMAGDSVSEEDVKTAVGRRNQSSERKAGAVAILPISGVLAPKMTFMMEMSGGTSLEMLSKRFKALVDDGAVGAIILDIDSPGGSVEGLADFAEEIYQARSKKKIVAIANTMACSAAYWLGSAADEFYAIKSSWVGSIGVYMVHHDFSKHLEDEGIKTTIISAGKFKAEANDFEPLTDEAKVHLQENVDVWYNMFVAAVARNRSVSEDDVRNGFGEGRYFPAETALNENMIDGIETVDGLIAKVSMPDEQARNSRGAAAVRERKLKTFGSN